MSNGTYWVLMMSHPAECTKAVGIGMSLGGVLTTSLSAFQLSGRSAEDPRFSVRAFFVVAAVLQGAGWLVALVVDNRFRRSSCCERSHELPDTTQEILLRKASYDWQPRTWREVSYHLISFWAHAGAYVVPTLMPFVAASYPTPAQEAHLLLWMLAMQQWGEWLGRILAPRAMRETLLSCCLVSMLGTFLFLVAVSLNADLLPQVVVFGVARFALPGLVLAFYMSYGIVQTAIFLRARSLSEDVAVAERIAATMGFLGQMGSFTSNLAATLIVNFVSKKSASCGH